jgi:replicative DNA helicase
VRRYAEIVREKSVLRQLVIAAGDEIVQLRVHRKARSRNGPDRRRAAANHGHR